ncbi:MAG: histidine phosphatase family protein [Lentisphaeria bacterium]|nr:histidine phosphatase family protein [Lentisphaeria bacterium]
MEESTLIYLVRHGETTANAANTLQGQSDVPLNEKGLHQAELVGARLRKKHFDAIVSSDLSRAALTACAIADGRPVEYTPLLREWDLGEWVGLSWDEVAEKFPGEAAMFKSGNPDALVSGGESRREFHARAAKIVQWLCDEYKGKEVLCVSHGGIIRAIFQVISGAGVSVPSVRTDNTCICCIRYFHTSGKWQIVTWNDTAHLEGMTLSTGW